MYSHFLLKYLKSAEYVISSWYIMSKSNNIEDKNYNT